MTYPAIRLKLAVADHFLRHLHTLLAETLALALAKRCPLACTQPIAEACTTAQLLRDRVAAIPTVFKQHPEEPTKSDVPTGKQP